MSSQPGCQAPEPSKPLGELGDERSEWDGAVAAEKQLCGPCLTLPGSGMDPALHPPPEQPLCYSRF